MNVENIYPSFHFQMSIYIKLEIFWIVQFIKKNKWMERVWWNSRDEWKQFAEFVSILEK